MDRGELALHGLAEDDKCDVVVAQGEPGKKEVVRLVEEFDVDPEFACERVGGAVDVAEFDGGVDRGEEGAVEPASALGDEFGDLNWFFFEKKRRVSQGTTT